MKGCRSDVSIHCYYANKYLIRDSFTSAVCQPQHFCPPQTHYSSETVFDEVSMLGCNMLNALNRRLQQAFPLNSDQPNGGCDLILLDIIQGKDTRDLFMTFSHGVSILGCQTKAFTVITG